MILLYGALTLAAQVILLREFLLLARGNEIFLGVGLWTWLAWTGAGSLWGGRLADRTAISRNLLAQLLVVLAITLPVTILVVRALPTLLGWRLGVAPPFGRVVFWYALLSGPFCVISGLFFPLACRWLQSQQSGVGLVGKAYGWDALGMGLGGVLLQVLLWGRWDSLWLALGWCLTLVGILAGLTLIRPRPRRPWILAVALLVVLGCGVAVFFRLPTVSRSWQWPHRTVLAAVETPLSVWTATQEAEQTSFAANGLWFFSYPDPQTAEEQVHYALLQHPEPREVLLLGGGVAGLAGEILKTKSVRRLDYVELDPRLIALAKQVLPSSAWQPLADERLRLIFEDGRRFVRRGGSRYDVILMALPEPTNALLNRFYTREFFQDVKGLLHQPGVFSFGLPGSETSLSPARRSFLGLTAATLREVFPAVLVLPGVTWRFFASPQMDLLTSEAEILSARRAARNLDLLYVREYYLQANLAPARLALAQQLLHQPEAPVNTDERPWGLYYGLLLAGLEADSWLPRVLLGLRQTGVGNLYAALALLTLAIWLWSWRHRRRRGQLPFLYSVFTMGLGVMGLEMVVLILFQVTLGYLYGQLSLLLAAFMVGMAGGSYLAGVGLARGMAARWLAWGCQAGLAVLMGLLGFSLPGLLRLSWLREDVWGQMTFALILIAGGLLAGGVFAAQAEMSRQQGATLALSAGRLYAVDLLGATLGTLGVGFLLLPCFGPAQALFLGAAWQASALLVGLSIGAVVPGRALSQEEGG